MLKSLKAKSMEDDAQLAIMVQPNAFPSVPKFESVSIRLDNSAEFEYTDFAPHACTQSQLTCLENSSA